MLLQLCPQLALWGGLDGSVEGYYYMSNDCAELVLS